jgi:arylformamidase
MIYDVSVPIDNGMPVWPSDPAVSLITTAIPSIDRRRTIRVTSIQMGSHTGTHIDAPNHFVEGGKKLHEIPLKALVGEVSVFHIAHVPAITRRHLELLDWVGVKRVLFKTDNSDHWKDGKFYENFVYLEPDAGAIPCRTWPSSCRDRLSLDRSLRFRSPSHTSGPVAAQCCGSRRSQSE